jgi:transcriptional regulator with XRE-family HTH domain
MSQEKLGFAARLSREYVSLLERDRKSPTVKVLLRLCEAMGVKAWKILKRAEEQGK